MKNIFNKASLTLKFSVLLILLSFNVKSFTQNLDSKGTEFWLTFPGNYTGTTTLTLFITSDVNTSGTVSVPGLAFSTPFSVSAGTVASVILPQAASLDVSNVIANNGIHVTSEDEVSVYGLDRQQYTTDAYLALPTDILGTEYINLGYKINGLASQFGIVATENGTTVTIVPTLTSDGHAAGVPYSISLNQGQTYLLRNSSVYGADLSGTLINSDKPIAVFGGHQCANIPVEAYACDYIVEQLPPTTTWGKNFITVPLKTRLNGDTFRFLAAEDNTEVLINGTLVATLNKGQLYEQIIAIFSQIVSTKPILVAQYSNGSSYDGVTSDPFMMLIPPYEQFLGGYTITTPASGFAQNFVNIVAPNAAIGLIKLDGVAIPAASFTAVGSTGFSGAQVNIGLGAHNFTGNGLPFGVFVYGFDSYDSYGYPGGQSLSEIARVTSVVLTPETGSALINTEQCFDALVKDQNDNPLEGIRVDFTITGANPGSSGFAFTDANGIAHFCYTGANEGTDNMTAAVGTITDGSTFGWTDVCDVTVSAKKFYDLNTDGIDNDNIPVQGWTISLSGTDENNNPVGPINQSTNASGTTSFTGVVLGSYTISEGTQTGWINTTSTTANLNLTECVDPAEIKFGNVCIGAGTSVAGTFGIGYWTNKNGQSMITGSYLCELNNLCLRNANGSNFDPVAGCPAPSNAQINAGKTALKNWLLNATATNMSYMLSAQLAGMKLNVLKGYVNANKLIYAPGTVSANAAGFASVNAIITEANNMLCANPVISSGNPLLATAEAIKNALDKANNNLNFVQLQPCGIVQPAVTRSEVQVEQLMQPGKLNLKAYPNPSRTYFILNVQASRDNPVSLRVTDAVGRMIETRKSLSTEQVIKIGEYYKPGVYIVQVIKGNNQETIKLIKQ